MIEDIRILKQKINDLIVNNKKAINAQVEQIESIHIILNEIKKNGHDVSGTVWLLDPPNIQNYAGKLYLQMPELIIKKTIYNLKDKEHTNETN